MNRVRKLAAFPSGRRTKWIVLVFWLAMVAGLGSFAGKLTDAQENETSSWLPGSAESTKVLEEQQSFQENEVAPAVIIYTNDDGITAADQDKADQDREAFAKVAGVDKDVEITGPDMSEDGKALQTVVPITLGDEGWVELPDHIKEIRGIAGADNPDGLQMNITGPAAYAADFGEAFEGIDTTLLLAAGIVVIAALLLTYRSPVLWLLPVITAAVALTISQAVIYLLAEYADLTVNAQSAGILTVLVFGAGTDYALLLVARYREELRRHEDRHEAMAFALRRAGPAIVASAATVAAGMLALLVAEMNSTRGMGPVLAIGIIIALAAMITLLPALLVIVGRWIFWPVKPRFGTTDPTATGFWSRVGTGISRRPRTVWVATVLILGAMAFGLTDLKSGVLSNQDALIDETDSAVGERVAAEHFPAGAGQPVVVIANADQADAVRTAIEDTDGIRGVAQPTVIGDKAMINGELADPADSDAARDTVDRVRDSVHAVPGADAIAGGDSAIAADASRASADDNWLVMPLILAVVFLILALLLRAVVAPLVLIATVVLSFAASLGASAFVFQNIFDFAGTDSSFPLFVFVFLVALGIDYNIFLMTRVREEVQHNHGTKRGALVGLAATGGVITSAGLVLAGTFAVLGTIPMVAFAEIGFAVAFGVLLDTLVVRAVLVTALNMEIGRYMWWPGKLWHKRDEPSEDLELQAVAAASK